MKIRLAITLAALLCSNSVAAATVTFGLVSGAGAANPHLTVGRPPTGAQVARGVPADARIHEFLVTTDQDIRGVREVTVSLHGSTTVFQVPTGSDVEPPLPVLEAAFPELGADSWITTPGLTAVVTDNPFNVPGESWFDTTDDGPVTDFMFARITVTSPGQFAFRGNIQVASGSGFEVFPFEFTSVPEPAGLALVGVGLIGVAALRRRRSTRSV